MGAQETVPLPKATVSLGEDLSPDEATACRHLVSASETLQGRGPG